jgi:hypothetical protein
MELNESFKCNGITYHVGMSQPGSIPFRSVVIPKEVVLEEHCVSNKINKFRVPVFMGQVLV